MLTDDYAYYKTKSRWELTEALAAMTAQQKASGELTDAQMEETYRMLAPLLSDGQRRELRSLLDQLK